MAVRDSQGRPPTRWRVWIDLTLNYVTVGFIVALLAGSTAGQLGMSSVFVVGATVVPVALVVVLAGRPRIERGSGGLMVRNLLRRHLVELDRIEGIASRRLHPGPFHAPALRVRGRSRILPVLACTDWDLDAFSAAWIAKNETPPC